MISTTDKASSSDFYLVRDYGAAGVAVKAETLELVQLNWKYLTYAPGQSVQLRRLAEGAELDSLGIQRAIDAAHSAGGGRVLVPTGHYLIGPIELKSRVTLQLAPGAFLWASPDLSDYAMSAETPANRGKVAGFNRDKAGLNQPLRRLISAYDAEDVSIVGTGRIEAQCQTWVFPWMNAVPEGHWPTERPGDTLYFMNCQRVRIEGIQLLNNPSWGIVLDGCQEVWVRGIRLRSFDVVNADGIDIVNSSQVTISDCHLHTMDDAICLKNTNSAAKVHSITVTNCVIRTLCNALKLGTDSLGDFEGICFSNIVVRNEFDDIKSAEGGISISAMDGGSMRNIICHNIAMHNVRCPIYIVSECRRTQQSERPEPIPGTICNVSISGVVADATGSPCFIVGQPEAPVRGVTIENVRIRKSGGFYKEAPHSTVPERPEQYPGPDMFGSRDNDQLPACGVYLRHAEEVYISNFTQENTESDCRELIVQEKSAEVELHRTRLL